MPRRLSGRTIAIASAIAAGALFLPATAGAIEKGDGDKYEIVDSGTSTEKDIIVVPEPGDGGGTVIIPPKGDCFTLRTCGGPPNDGTEIGVITPDPGTGGGGSGGQQGNGGEEEEIVDPGTGGGDPGTGTETPKPGGGTDEITTPENPLAGLLDMLTLAFGS